MKLTGRYFLSLLSFFSVDNYIKLDQINFYKPWWCILWAHKWSWVLILLGAIIWHCFFTLLPILVTTAFNPTSSITLGFIIVMWLVAESFKHFTLFIYSFVSMRIPASLQYSVYLTFFTKQYPINYVPGVVCAKIERCTQAYKGIFELMVFELLPIFTSLVTMTISFFVLSKMLGIITLICLGSLFVVSTLLFLLNRYAFEPHILQADDDAKVAGLEGLLQVKDTTSINADMYKLQQHVTFYNLNALKLSIIFWLGFYGINFLTRVMWVGSVFAIGSFLQMLVQDNTLQTIQATTFLISYIHSTNKIRQVGRRIEHLAQCILRINDLFLYIQDLDRKRYFLPSKESQFQDSLSPHANNTKNHNPNT